MYFKDFSQKIKEILPLLEGKKLAIVGHMRPDGDCIGSQVAMQEFFSKICQRVDCINYHNPTRILMPFTGGVKFFNIDNAPNDYDYFVSVDCSDESRFSSQFNEKFSDKKIFINFDHHISNKNFAIHNIVAPHISSTCELLAGILLDLDFDISTVVAEALFLGVQTDTGQFKYPSTTKQTFEIAGSLIEKGANIAKVSSLIYNNESMAKMKLLQIFLSSLKMHFDEKVCIGILTGKSYEQSCATREESEGFVDYPRSISGVQIAALLEETDSGSIKGSLRGQDMSIRVDLLAGLFGGGGHAAASGFNVWDTSLEEFYPVFIEKIKEHLEKYGK